MSEDITESIEGNWNKRPISNTARYVQYVGLDSVTVRNSDQKPFFFLFIDLDSKDNERLRGVLNICRRRKLRVYFYESCKGWHVISPCLLNIRVWAGIRKELEKLQDYSGDTIRWSPRYCDGKMLYTENWNTGKNQFNESYDLHYAILNKFQCDFDKFNDNIVSTQLQWNIYNQMRLKKIRHF